MSVLLNHILSTVTETSGPPALNTLPYPSIFMQCKSRLGFTDVICTGPEGVYGNSISLMRTDLPRQKLNYVNWLNVPKVHGMLLIVPCRPITVNIPCTLIWQGDSCTLSSLSSCSPTSSCSLLPCAMSEPAPSPCLVADSDTPGQWIPAFLKRAGYRSRAQQASHGLQREHLWFSKGAASES